MEFYVVSNGKQVAGQTSSCPPTYFCVIIFITFITSPYMYSLHAFPRRETNSIVVLHTMKAELHGFWTFALKWDNWSASCPVPPFYHWERAPGGPQ